MQRSWVLPSRSVALVLAATATGSPTEPAQSGSCAKANLNLVEDGQLSLATDNPAFPPWWGGAAKKPWEVSNPASGKGYESAVAYAVAKQLGFAKGQVTVERGAVQQLVPAREQAVRLLHGAGLVRARAREERLLLELVLLRQPGGRRECGHADLARPDGRRPPAATSSARRSGTTSYSYITRFIRPSQSPAVYDSNNDAISALNAGQIDGIVVDLPTAFFVVAVQLENGTIVGKLPQRGARERFGMVFEKGNSLTRCVNRALNRLWANGTIRRLQRTYLARAGAPDLR